MNNEKKTNPFEPKKDPSVEEKQEEVIKEVKQEEVRSEPEQPQDSPRILLSDTDAYIHDRMKAQPMNVSDVSLKFQDKKDPSVHRLTLPKELKEAEKKFVFKWLMKHKKNLDYNCDVRGWTIVNRTYFPELPHHMFTVNGSVERGDCILAFIPRKVAEARRKEPSKLSEERVKGMYEKHKHNPRYYKPEAGTNEADGKEVQMI